MKSIKVFLTLLLLNAFGAGIAHAQMQIDKAIQLTGSGSNARIEGIQDVSANDHAANKIYVDTSIANNMGGPAPCPSGFVAANNGYCIEINERSALTYYQAATTCADANLRLCSLSEWHYACQKSGLGVSNILGNYEWVDDASNPFSYPWVTTMGQTSCIEGNGADPRTDSRVYRCCLSR